MIKYKERIKRNLPFIFFTIYLIIIHCCMLESFGDDLWFANYKNTSLIDIMTNRYMTWTSRFIFDTLLFIFNSHIPKLWIVINIMCCYLIYLSLNKIFNKKNKLYIKYIIVLLFMMYPFIDMGSSGWKTTTIVYIWPLALGLFSFSVLLNEEFNKNKVLQILGFISLFISSNQEQVCLLIIGFLTVFIIYSILKKQKVSKQMIIYISVAIIMILNHLLCPGNSVRTDISISTSFPDFLSISIFGKIGLALNNTFEMIYGQMNYIFIFMMVVLLIVLIKNKEKKIYIYGCFSIIFLSIFMPFTSVYSASKLYGGYLCPTGENCIPVLPIIQYGSKKYILSIFISIYTVCMNLILLYRVNVFEKDKYKRLLIPVMFLAAICSRLAAGFSPTLYISGYRTGIFMYFLFMGITISLLNKLKLKRIEENLLLTLISIFVLFNHFIELSLNIRI